MNGSIVWRLLLRIYPPSFRQEFGEALIADFRRLGRQVRRENGWRAAAGLWALSLADLLRSGWHERRRRKPRRPSGSGRRLGVKALLGDLVQDAGHGLRLLRRNPGYAAAVVLTLGLGIGANTAIFSLVSGVLISPLPYQEGSRLVHLRQERPQINDDMSFSVQEILDYRDRNRSLQEMTEYHSMTFTLLGRGEPERVNTGVVSAHFFEVMGVEPLLGRTFTPEDDTIGSAPVMILSYSYWQERFSGDPQVVGEGLTMNDRVHTVIGVLPPVPQYPDENAVYMPTSHCPTRSNPRFIADRRRRMMTVFGRLKSSVELPSAQSDFERISGALAEEYPEAYSAETRGYRVRVVPFKEELVSAARPTLLILLSATGLILLTACANVAALALARAKHREGELAVRGALGASRWRLFRQLVTESLTLSIIGGGVGVLAAWQGMDLLVSFVARLSPRAFEAVIDLRVLMFAAGLSLVTGVFFGAFPGLFGRPSARASCGRHSGASDGSARQRLQGALVVAQLAVSFMLLVGAGLFIRTFWELSRVDPGYRPENVLSADLRLGRNYTDETDDVFFERLFQDLRALPGVSSVARSGFVPMDEGVYFNGLELEERPLSVAGDYSRVTSRVVSADFFTTLGVSLVSGRFLEERDRLDTLSTTIVNRTLARSQWGEADALGKRVRVCSLDVDSCTDWLEIVGVVGDVHTVGLDIAPHAQIYLPDTTTRWGGNKIFVRSSIEPSSLGTLLVDRIHALDPDIPVSDVRTLGEVIGESLAPRRLTAALMGLFAVLALGVTLAGVAAVVAISTSRRTREIGIRMALGADRRSLLTMILGRSMLLAAVGLTIGLAGALALSQGLSDVVWGVSTTDLPTLLAVAGVLLAGVLLSCYLPARRATRIDPLIALKTE